MTMPPRERDIVIDVTIREDVKGAHRAADALGDVDKAADRAGGGLRGMADDAKSLDAEITKTTTHLKELETQMVTTGDRTMRRRVASERSWLRELVRIQQAMTPQPGPGGPGGFSNIGDMMSKVPSRWNAIGGGIAAAVGPGPISPFLGAGAAGLASGAIGTVGVAGALLMASRDPKVMAAAGALGTSIAQEFFRDSDAFAKPALQAMTILDDAFKQMKVPEAFLKMAPHVTTIADGIGRLGINLMPGLNKAFDRMGPFADAAADGMADLGSALGIFMDEITASPGAVMGLDAMFKLLNGTIILTGRFLHMLSDAFMLMVETAEGMFGSMPFLGDMLRDIMLKSSGAASGVDEFNAAGKKVEPTLNDLIGGFTDFATIVAESNAALIVFNDTISGMIDDQLALDKANLAVEQGWADLTEEILTNGGALGDGTQAARDNEAAILSQIDKLSNARDEYIKVTGKTDEATAAYDAQIRSLIELGVKAGISREALEALAGNYYVTVAFQADMSRWLNQFGSMIPGQGQPGFFFAGGGTTPAHSPFVVGENGPEMMFSSRQHFVANRQQMMAGGGGGGGGLAPIVVTDPIGQAVFTQIRHAVAAAGGDVQAFFGQN